jgi:hypothetical protein
MAIIVLEGFDGLANAGQLPLRHWHQVGDGLTYSATGGRRGGGCVTAVGDGTTSVKAIQFLPENGLPPRMFHTTGLSWEVGFAWRYRGTLPSADTDVGGISFSDNSNVVSTRVGIRYQHSNGLFYPMMYTSDGAGTLRIGPGNAAGVPIPPNTWAYFTFVYNTGSVTTSTAFTVWVNKINVFLGTMSQLGSTLSSEIHNRLILGGNDGLVSGYNIPSGGFVDYDDVWIVTNRTPAGPAVVSSTTLGNNVFFSPVRIELQQTNAEATNFEGDFTPSSGSSERAMVNEAPHDGDATYVESNTINHIAQGGLNAGTNAGMPTLPNLVRGVRAFAVARSTNGDTANVSVGVGRDTFSTYTAFPHVLPSENQYVGITSYRNIREHGPTAGTTPWDLTSLKQATALLKIDS